MPPNAAYTNQNPNYWKKHVVYQNVAISMHVFCSVICIVDALISSEKGQLLFFANIYAGDKDLVIKKIFVTTIPLDILDNNIDEVKMLLIKYCLI